MHSDEALRRAQALFRKEQQAREGEQAMAEYQAKLDAMREKNRALASAAIGSRHRKGASGQYEGCGVVSGFFESLTIYSRSPTR